MYKVHRLVVLPDFQGIGVGARLLDFIAKKYNSQKKRFTITTSNSALINSLIKNKKWALTRKGRTAKSTSKLNVQKGYSGKNRITCSFEFK